MNVSCPFIVLSEDYRLRKKSIFWQCSGPHTVPSVNTSNHVVSKFLLNHILC